MKKIAIIFPAFNEARVISKTIQNVQAEMLEFPNFKSKTIVVDDGSDDHTQLEAQKNSHVVLHHRHNRGLGAALATGIEYVRRRGNYDYCVTFDSDGQHNPKDIKHAIKKLEEGYDVVIGSRFLNRDQKFPKFRKTILHLSNLVTYFFFQVWTTDSQSGFRAFNKKAVNTLELRTNRMEVSSEFFAEIKRHQLKFAEIPIRVKYTKYSIHKGQSNIESFKILIKLIYKLFH